MIIAEVVETLKSFKPNQSDEEGNKLPLGSIQIRIGSHESNLGQVKNIWARPSIFSRRIPLIGEMVLCFSGPANDWTTSSIKGNGFYYFCPINAVDDLVLHAFPRIWKRKGLAPNKSVAERENDREEFGYNFPKEPDKVPNLQPFEGDDLIEGRFGTSIRFGSTISKDLSPYQQKPTWKPGSGKNTDPILILRTKKTDGSQSYTIEDIEKDESSIYLSSTQMLQKLKAGFDKNLDAKQLGNYSDSSQIAINSGRVVINSSKDILFLIGKKSAILTGKKVLFQSDKYKVDLDDLMDFLKKWLGEDVKHTQGSSQFATPSGPTAVSTALAQYIQLQNVDFTKFKQP